MKRLITGAALLCCLAIVASAGLPAPSASAATISSGQLIFVDPNTGELRQPTVEEWAQLPRPIAPKAKASPQQVLPDGSIYIPAEAVMQHMTASIGEDGEVHIDCDDAPAAP